jgi:hypothetical protein
MTRNPLEELKGLLDSGDPRVRDFPPEFADPGELRPPLDPRVSHLPLAEQDGFSWPQFESFCADLLQLLFETSHVSRYGGSGSEQEGIDIAVESSSGRRIGAQCKQRSRFGPAEVKAAIAAASFEADSYLILLSRVATSAARKVVKGDPRWELFDVDDISRLVRSLAPEDARVLVENHFGPRWRRRFLGTSGPALFVSPELAFSEPADREPIYHHHLQLIGREKELVCLDLFREAPESSVAILVGPGGIGKTKLLRTFAENTDGPKIVFVSGDVPVTPEGLDELTVEPTIIVLDDAHRREDLDQIIGFVDGRRRRNGQALKILISTRPRRLEELDSILWRCGFDPGEITRLQELRPLSGKDTERLAEEALGRGDRRHAQALAAASADCPLITVVGAELIRRRQVPAALLVNQEDFRSAVLGRFHEELVGDFGPDLSPEDAKELLDAVAAVGPFPLDDGAVLAILSDFVEIRPDKVVRFLGRLESSGVLVRRGRQVRISPDLLADYILERACLSDAGPTGYAAEAYRRFEPVLPGHVLRNLAELDWRMRAADREVDLLGDAWKSIKAEVLAVDNHQRRVLLDRLEPIAYFQPGQVLEIVEAVLENPRDEQGMEFLGMRLHTHAEVLERLPAILQAVAYNARFVDRVVELLWVVGGEVDENANRTFGIHPIGVLKELASYSPTKPVGFNDLVLTAVDRLLGEAAADGRRHLLVDVIGKLLEREGTDTWSRDRREIVMNSFLISPQVTAAIRVRAIAILRREARSEEALTGYTATKRIGEAMRGPFGLFGAEISAEERDVWLPEQLRLVELFDELSGTSPSPPIKLAIVDALGWHAELSPWPVVTSSARAVLDGIEEDLDYLVAGAIREPWSLDWLAARTQRFGAASRERDQLGALHRRVARALIQRFGDQVALLAFIESRLRELEAAEQKSELGPLLWALAEEEPGLAVRIATLVIEDSSRAVACWLGSLVAAIRSRDADLARDLSFRALDGGDGQLAEGVARSYWSAGWLSERDERDIEIIERLLQEDEPRIRALALHGVATLAEEDSRSAVSLAVEVFVGDSLEIAEALCGAFDPRMGIALEELTDAQLKSILGKFVEIKSIEDHAIVEFLAYAGGRVPGAVVDLLVARIAQRPEAEERGYQPLPFERMSADLVSGAVGSHLSDLIRRVGLLGMDKETETFWLARLFRIVSRNFSPTAVEFLFELARSGEERELERAVVLTECAPTSFVFEHTDFVDLVLARVEAKSEEFRNRIRYLLGQSASDQWRSGPVGEPFPQDLELREKASQARDRSPLGSASWRFFAEMADSAERQIKSQMEYEDDF